MNNNSNGDCKRPEVTVDYEIELPESVKSKYKISHLKGTVLNLHLPGGYKHPDLSKLQKADDFMCKWWINRGLMEEGTKYHIKFKDNFAHLARLLIPGDLPEELMRCHDFFLGWTFQHDDVMDNLKDHRTADFKGGYPTVAAASQVFCDIMTDDYGREHQDNFPNVDFPLFKPLSHTWKDFHTLLHQQIPYYEARNGFFLKYLTEYFNSYELSHGERINRRFSEESGKYWLRFATGFKPWMELVVMVRGVVIPLKMRKDFYFLRLRTTSEDVIGFINDVFGISKDLVNEETDTLVMFKHIEKGVPLEEAYKETVDFLNEQLRDMLLLIDVLRKRYPDDPNAEGYLRALEDFIDGYIIWCGTCKRYGRKTTMTYRTIE